MRLTLVVFVLFNFCANAQDFVSELNGFKLGQFRDVPKNELKTIIQKESLEDGYEYEIFLVQKDTSAYMIFEYAPNDLQTIWSIQLTGSKKGFDCSFKGLHLGMSKSEVEKNVGQPSSTMDAGEYGTRWIYENGNYSLEIGLDDTLAGIKIIDQSNTFFPKADLSKIPSYTKYSEILKTDDREKIADLLAPGMEIYKKDSVYYFKNSMANEIKNDGSGLFELIKEMRTIINKTDAKDNIQYNEDMRITENQGVLHVAKFNLDGKYSEIVFKHILGNYLIWEIKLD